MSAIIRQLIKDMLGKGRFVSYSQNGEDAVIRKLLPNDSTYLDVGCYHPKLYSNTYAFYRMGWHGTVIDANPAMKPLFRFFRPRDTFIHAAIGTSRTLKYFEFSDGAYNTLDRVLAEEPKRKKLLERVIDVPVLPLSQLISGPVEFLNVDVEGFDLQVLQTYDWTYKPKVICVEAECHDFLVQKGYQLYAKLALSSIYLLQ
jgi:FkbM family methyltransferase